MVDFIVLLGMASQYDASRYKVDRCEDVYGQGAEQCGPEREVVTKLREELENDWYNTIKAVALYVIEDELSEHRANYHRRDEDYD